jgi:hypothetical protein
LGTRIAPAVERQQKARSPKQNPPRQVEEKKTPETTSSVERQQGLLIRNSKQKRTSLICALLEK